MLLAPPAFLLLTFEFIRFDYRRSKKKYDVEGNTAVNSADGDVTVVETADSYNSESDSDSDSDSDDSDSDSDDDK